MTFTFSVPCRGGNEQFAIEPGGAMIFVGANGGGKTRLAVLVETALGLSAHRISAHRALNLNPDVAKISEEKAKMGLRTGHADVNAQLSHRQGSRWGGAPQAAIRLLNDFDFLIQVLFAEQANTSLKAYNQHKPGVKKRKYQFQLTRFDVMREIWSRLLPHRILHISGDNILVSLPNSELKYKASEMSDGERAIFYMIGQTLVAEPNSVLIIDEPELHVHRSIMSKLWDELEAARPDCAFVFITHDLEFAASRTAQKYIIRDYDPTPIWTIERVPEDTGFSEELTTLILGSRRPILFVEGNRSSLDLALYRCCYPDWTVVPRSSCTEVIHAVVTMRANEDLTRITCSGIVDADDHSEEDKEYLSDLHIKTLPVAEIENLLLLPSVSRAIAESDGYRGAELDTRLTELADAIFQSIASDEKIEVVAVRYAKRRIDRILKKTDLSEAKTVDQLEQELKARIEGYDVRPVAEQLKGKIKRALEERNLPLLLAHYDNKGLLSIAASKLRATRQQDFEGWITRTLRNNANPALIKAISGHLPKITAS